MKSDIKKSNQITIEKHKKQTDVIFDYIDRKISTKKQKYSTDIEMSEVDFPQEWSESMLSSNESKMMEEEDNKEPIKKLSFKNINN